MRFRICILMLTAFAASSIISACDARLIGLTFKPSSFDFGAIDRTTEKTQIFKLKNQINEVAQITSIIFFGANVEDFSIQNGLTTPFMLQPLETKLITIVFAPKSAGRKNAKIVVQSLLEQSKTVSVELRGLCYSAEIQPSDFDFGEIELGDKTQNTFTFENKTKRAINITAIEVLENSIASAHYTVISGDLGIVKASYGKIDIVVEFEPKNFGTKNALLTVKTDDVTFTEVICELTGFGDLDLFEEFDDTAMCDVGNTTAEWSTLLVGKLIPTGLNNFGSGKDGKYNPLSDTQLNADNGPFEYTEIEIPVGITVTVIGSQALEILCQGKVIIKGVIELDGKDGQDAGSGSAGGAGGPGGSAGGAGATRTGTTSTAGIEGSGLGGGKVGTERSGGGAGYAVKGQDGESDAFVGADGGLGYGTFEITTLDGGSGGGGGATYFGTIFYFDGGGDAPGGGGGGGAMQIIAAGNVEINGLISANGGNGGGHQKPGGTTKTCFGGGGGSGGAVKLVSAADIKFTGGSISVLGGFGDDGLEAPFSGRHRGGYGSSGRVRLEDSDGAIEGIGGSIYPKPSMAIVSNAFTGGTGSDGAFAPVSSITLDTSNGAFNYTSVNIPAGVTVSATGQNPLEIFSTGNITVEGTIDVSGESANLQDAGVGVAGGFSGGRGGNGNSNGNPGLGTGGGKANILPWYTGDSSGGGFGTAGQKGSTYNVYPGGIVYGTPELTVLQGGSGGGSGAGCFDVGGASGGNGTDAGGGGGAGGGALRLQAAGTITLADYGKIYANGGTGGQYGGAFAHPGSGGSGGAILIQGDKVLIKGLVSARGGAGGPAAGVISSHTHQGDECYIWQGAWGGDGRIRLEAIRGNIGAMLITTKGKFSTPGFPNNPELHGTCSIATAPINAGLLGQSLWYDSTIDDPVWQDAVLTGEFLGQVTVYYEGAEDDGAGMPDLNTLTGWVDDVSQLGNPRYLRFKIVFTIGTDTPTLDRIDLPFTD